jgi:hypothetical protein
VFGHFSVALNNNSSRYSNSMSESRIHTQRLWNQITKLETNDNLEPGCLDGTIVYYEFAGG